MRAGDGVPPGIDLREVLATFQALAAVDHKCRRAQHDLRQREGAPR